MADQLPSQGSRASPDLSSGLLNSILTKQIQAQLGSCIHNLGRLVFADRNNSDGRRITVHPTARGVDPFSQSH